MSKFKQKSVGWHSPEGKAVGTESPERDILRDELGELSSETLDIDRVWWIGLPRNPAPKKSWF